MAEQITYLPEANTSRRPRTEEEVQIIYDLDMEVFEQLTRMWDGCSLKRDPAYLVWGVRRHFFWHFWGVGTPYLEPRPIIGSPPVACCDETRPWYVPGLEKIERLTYPKGWDDFVKYGIKPAGRKMRIATVAEPTRRYATSSAVPKLSEDSTQLLAAKKELKDLDDAKALREIEARTAALRLEELAAKEKMALNAIEAEKAAIRIRALTSGRHGFGNPIVAGPSVTPGLGGSRWVPPTTQPSPALHREDEFPRLKPTSTQPPAQIPPRAKVSLPASEETALQRERTALGWTHRTEKKPAGTRQGMGRVSNDIIIATLRKKWLTHFQSHKDIVLKIKKETHCVLTIVYDGSAPFWEMKIEGKEGKPFSSVQNALEMMICYCEDIIKTEGKPVKGSKETMSDAPRDLSCHNCGARGHFKSQCPTIECRNCGAKGHDVTKCPKPPQLSGRCFKCGKPGHKEVDCGKMKTTTTQTKGSQSQQLKSEVSSFQDTDKSFARSSKWTNEWLQSQVKQQAKEREDALGRIQDLMLKLNDGEKSLPRLLQLNKQPISVLQDEERSLQAKVIARYGDPGLEIVFKETHKKRKIPVDLKSMELSQQGAASENDSSAPPAPDSARLSVPQVIKTVLTPVEKEAARQGGATADLPATTPMPKRSWASECESHADSTEEKSVQS